jgi:hypothetical protein
MPNASSTNQTSFYLSTVGVVQETVRYLHDKVELAGRARVDALALQIQKPAASSSAASNTTRTGCIDACMAANAVASACGRTGSNTDVIPPITLPFVERG